MKKSIILLLSICFFSCDGSYYAKQIASLDISDAQNLILASPSATSSRAVIGNGESRKLYKETEEGSIQEVFYFDESGKVINPALYPVNIEQINDTHIAIFYVQSEYDAETWEDDSHNYLSIDYAIFISDIETGHLWLMKEFKFSGSNSSESFSIIPHNGTSFFLAGNNAIYFMRFYDAPEKRSATISKLSISNQATISDFNVEWDEQSFSQVSFYVDGFDNILYFDASEGVNTGHMGCLGASGFFDYQDVSYKNLNRWSGSKAPNGYLYFQGYEDSTQYYHEIKLNNLSKIEFTKTAYPINEYGIYMGRGEYLNATTLLCYFSSQNSTPSYYTYNTAEHSFTEEIIDLSAPTASWQTRLRYRSSLKSIEVVNILDDVVGEIKAADSNGNNLLIQLTEFYELSDNIFRLRGKNIYNKYVIYDVTYDGTNSNPAVLIETELFDSNTMDLIRLK